MSSNRRVKRSTFKKPLKLLSAKMPVIWKPMTQPIRCTWNNFLAKANVLIDLKQESWSWRDETTNLSFGMQCEWTELYQETTVTTPD